MYPSVLFAGLRSRACAVVAQRQETEGKAKKEEVLETSARSRLAEARYGRKLAQRSLHALLCAYHRCRPCRESKVGAPFLLLSFFCFFVRVWAVLVKGQQESGCSRERFLGMKLNQCRMFPFIVCGIFSFGRVFEGRCFQSNLEFLVLLNWHFLGEVSWPAQGFFFRRAQLERFQLSVAEMSLSANLVFPYLFVQYFLLSPRIQLGFRRTFASIWYMPGESG